MSPSSNTLTPAQPAQQNDLADDLLAEDRRRTALTLAVEVMRGNTFYGTRDDVALIFADRFEAYLKGESK